MERILRAADLLLIGTCPGQREAARDVLLLSIHRRRNHGLHGGGIGAARSVIVHAAGSAQMSKQHSIGASVTWVIHQFVGPHPTPAGGGGGLNG